MTNTLRITAHVVLVVLVHLSTTATEPSSTPIVTTSSAADSFTVDEQELVDFAFSQFDSSGIALPDVSIVFPSKESECYGFGGFYIPAEQAVRICRPSKTTMIHELAHAWIETTITDDERGAFLELRGLETWVGGDEWDQRGAEQAAEIVTWGVMDENISVRWLETDAVGTTTETWRLFKVPDSTPDLLAAAYESLTGDAPHLRLADDPRVGATETIMSPELRG